MRNTWESIKEWFKEVNINKPFLSMTTSLPSQQMGTRFPFLIPNLFWHIWPWSQHGPHLEYVQKNWPLNWENNMLDLLLPIQTHTNLHPRPCKSGWVLIKAGEWILHSLSCLYCTLNIFTCYTQKHSTCLMTSHPFQALNIYFMWSWIYLTVLMNIIPKQQVCSGHRQTGHTLSGFGKSCIFFADCVYLICWAKVSAVAFYHFTELRLFFPKGK